MLSGVGRLSSHDEVAKAVTLNNGERKVIIGNETNQSIVELLLARGRLLPLLRGGGNSVRIWLVWWLVWGSR